MNKFKHLYIFLMLMFSVVCSSSQLMGQEAAQVDVSSQVIRTIPNDMSFTGINWMDDHPNNRYMFSNTEHKAALGKKLTESNIKSVRYPSGMNVGHSFWDVSTKDIYAALAKPLYGNEVSPYLKWMSPYDRLDFQSFLDFCKQYKLQSTIQVNTHKYFDKSDNTIHFLKDYEYDENNKRILDTGILNLEKLNYAAKYAAKQMHWVKLNGYDNNVAYWEIGNEEYIRGVRQQTWYTGSEYGKIVGTFIKEMKKIAPSAKFLVTTFALPFPANPLEKPEYFNLAYIHKWNTDLLKSPELKEVANDIYGFTVHIYTYEDYANNTVDGFKKSIYNNSNIDITKKLNLHKKTLADYGYANKKIFVNEFNTNDMNSQYSHTWLGALGNSKLIMSCAVNKDCDHLDYHNVMQFYDISNDVYKNKGYGLMHYATYLSKPFFNYPGVDATKLLNNSLKGKVLKTSSSNSDVYSVTVQDGEQVRIVVLNFKNDRYITLNHSNLPYNLKYTVNESLGIGVPELFTAIDSGQSNSNPTEVRQINILPNAINVSKKTSGLIAAIPGNTLSVFNFEIEEPPVISNPPANYDDGMTAPTTNDGMSAPSTNDGMSPPTTSGGTAPASDGMTPPRYVIIEEY